MQRKPSYYFRKSLTAALAAGAGLVLGIQVDAHHEAHERVRASHFTAQRHAAGAFVPFVATPVLLTPDPTHRVDAAPERDAGVKNDRIHI